MELKQMLMPGRLYWDKDTLSETYGKFYAEPFERGFGVTLGNSLRRVLLSSIMGTSIIWVKIEGVAHEISTIPGVKEDVTDIILNLKGINFQITDDNLTAEISLDVNKAQSRSTFFGQPAFFHLFLVQFLQFILIHLVDVLKQFGEVFYLVVLNGIACGYAVFVITLAHKEDTPAREQGFV